MALSPSIQAMMRPEAGVISREIFVDAEVYQLELKKLFTRAWLFVGHESLIPNPGDFYASRMGEESVILCRDKRGEIHVFLNSCRHRGMKVCRYDQGNTSLFTCPYHSWSYTTDGKLQGVPQYRTLYEGHLDRDEWSLIKVAQMTNYKGSIWATWDADAPDFVTYLGDARVHLDEVLDCRDGREGGSEVIGVMKWVMPANWKFAAENFLGDSYHNPSHRSVDLIGIGPSAAKGVKGRRDGEMQEAQHVWVSFPPGHGIHSIVQPEDNDYVESFKDDPEIEDYFRHCYHERKRRLGNERARLLGFTATYFPNTSVLARQPRGFCAWHPNGPTSTEAWRFFLVDKDAPAKVKDRLRRYYMRYSGPPGMTEQDDMENWLYATNASMGTIARRYPFNYQQSLGAVKENDLVRGTVSRQMTEQNARSFYRAWNVYMNDGTWSACMGQESAQDSAQDRSVQSTAAE
jgi:phenylpropionate dioxygenase-like ring-hydroxylating dioxygenase large terminal subunit